MRAPFRKRQIAMQALTERQRTTPRCDLRPLARGDFPIIATHPEANEPKARGRHRSVEAEAAILKATLYLLARQPLRRVTTDAIAQRAGVSKATIYKWWPNKNMVALDAYLAGMTEQVLMPDTGSAELDFTVQLKSLTAFYTSPLGRLFGQFLAEGQSDPEFLALFRERFLSVRRDAARVMWRRGVERGEIRDDIDSEMVLDLIYGPLVFRLLAGHGPLNEQQAETVVTAVFGGLRRDKPFLAARGAVALKRPAAVPESLYRRRASIY